MSKIKILHVTAALDTGGVETLLTNYYKYFNRDDFDWSIITMVDKNHKEGVMENNLKKMGVKVFYMPRKIPTFFQQLICFNRFLKNHHFDIIHCHVDEFNVFYLAIAKFHKIPVRISHCHIAFTHRGLIFEIISKIVKPMLRLTYTHSFACSKDAATFLYGDINHTYIMKNAINTNKFKFSIIAREKIRKQYNLENNFVVGCVGRFHWQKNHDFLLNVFYEILKIDHTSRLMLVGEGELKTNIVKKAKHLEILDKIIFIGTTNEVESYLSCMDVFVLPSRYEGLGIVYIESQATNLHTFAPIEAVPHEIAISPYMHFISNTKTPKDWALQIHNIKSLSNNRLYFNNYIEASGYEIKNASANLQKKYKKLISQTFNL